MQAPGSNSETTTSPSRRKGGCGSDNPPEKFLDELYSAGFASLAQQTQKSSQIVLAGANLEQSSYKGVAIRESHLSLQEFEILMKRSSDFGCVLASREILTIGVRGKIAHNIFRAFGHVLSVARGLGLASAQVLAETGTNIAVLDIIPSDEALERIKADCEVKAEYYKTDVTNGQEFEQCIETIQEAFDSVGTRQAAISLIGRPTRQQSTGSGDINAAHVVLDKPFSTTSGKNLPSTFAVNVYILYALAISLAARRQCIATHIRTTVQHISAYVASMGAARGLVKPLAMELAPHRNRVNSLSPGDMMMDMMRGLQVK
ncbi:MAG: hypothetical protein Q9161_003908 [Pseudevernia consocians]